MINIQEKYSNDNLDPRCNLKDFYSHTLPSHIFEKHNLFEEAPLLYSGNLFLLSMPNITQGERSTSNSVQIFCCFALYCSISHIFEKDLII